MKKNYLLQIVVALDQLGNTVLGGWADETMSSRAYRDQSLGWRWLRWVLDHIQESHTAKAYRSERLRLQQPPELR
jgi:hypothetical protein